MITKPHSHKSTLLIALACAAVVHIGLLLITLSIQNPINLVSLEPITIQLQNTIKPSIEPVSDDQEVSQEQLEQPLKQPEPNEIVTRPVDVDADEDIAPDSQPVDQQATTATIINSAEYKQWISSETNNYIENNPDSLADFADTFALPVIETTADTEIEISPLGTGMTMVRRNGRVTCQLQTVLPFQNDFSKPFMTYKDCTSAKKFVLNTK